ncbi:hypothetical protein QTJ16_000878 [Diplocarpon rosae]|uniref:CPAF-like PDZ domain-containing protein n=1 Tax=Diplocarpon rosae TaxID=946125 RepID=A0AAD9T6Y9_9HELO|nr:hypothetical protein QTJ16_000878 [Diplocarpon rosae]
MMRSKFEFEFSFTSLSFLLLATTAAADCAADNCLRALRASGRLSNAQQFCATLRVESVAVAAIAIPSYALNACKDNQNAPLSARLLSACGCIVATATTSMPPPPTTTAPPTLTEACALVSISSSVQRVASPSATPTVAAQLAHDCLNSVPLNKTAAIQLVDSMEPYLEWQSGERNLKSRVMLVADQFSDTAWKKDPPADYFYPPHDIFAYLASVKSNLERDIYANEYEFQEDLYQVFARAHDGHFIFYPDALTKAFEWGRKRSLVSISEDGTSLPVIKLYGESEDVISSPSTASVVTQINGVEASKYVADFIFTASFNQDADAAYNTMFFKKAFVAGGIGNGYFSAGGRIRYIYPGSNTTFVFANGTTLVMPNIARVKGLFSAVTDGASFYTRFCTGPKSSGGLSETPEEPEESLRDATLNATGYPVPVIITSDSVVSGYYLDGIGFEEVAVISVLAFESNSIIEFQSVAEQFFARAKADGKTKLVVDLSANAEIFSVDSAKFDPHTATSDEINKAESFFNDRYDLNLTNQPFQCFASKFGPSVIDGFNYTEIVRWNLDDPLTTSNDTFGIGTDVTGYGSRKNFTQPFEASNIIMLLDGYCASTCTLFTEFMRTQAGVRSVAMGGRPQPGPIQGVGGVKGAQILDWSNIFDAAQSALKSNATSPAQVTVLNKLAAYPINRASSTGINVRDNILPANLGDGLPAQFVREEADCRLFYTRDMVTDVTALWKAAAGAAFKGEKCVFGGLGRTHAQVKRAGLQDEKKIFKRPVSTKPVLRRAKQKTNAHWVGRHGRKAIP